MKANTFLTVEKVEDSKHRQNGNYHGSGLGPRYLNDFSAQRIQEKVKFCLKHKGIKSLTRVELLEENPAYSHQFSHLALFFI